MVEGLTLPVTPVLRKEGNARKGAAGREVSSCGTALRRGLSPPRGKLQFRATWPYVLFVRICRLDPKAVHHVNALALAAARPSILHGN
jgi:hypothetical protein